jgi:hypothetical protein
MYVALHPFLIPNAWERIMKKRRGWTTANPDTSTSERKMLRLSAHIAVSLRHTTLEIMYAAALSTEIPTRPS